MNTAYQLAKQAGLCVTARELELLANDLQELACEDGLSLEQASRELARRIGGPRNLRSYLDVLAQPARGRGEANATD